MSGTRIGLPPGRDSQSRDPCQRRQLLHLPRRRLHSRNDFVRDAPRARRDRLVRGRQPRPDVRAADRHRRFATASNPSFGSSANSARQHRQRRHQPHRALVHMIGAGAQDPAPKMDRRARMQSRDLAGRPRTGRRLRFQLCRLGTGGFRSSDPAAAGRRAAQGRTVCHRRPPLVASAGRRRTAVRRTNRGSRRSSSDRIRAVKGLSTLHGDAEVTSRRDVAREPHDA